MSVIKSKNTSPSRLSLYNALILAILMGAFGAFLDREWQVVLAMSCITFVVTYFLYFYTLQYFIYRKIKLIYKFIFQTKATKREEFFYKNILPQKSIDEVSHDVEQWALQKKGEIESLKQNEQFRKEFLMNLAHELRTPIFTVQGYVHTLLGGAINDPNVNIKFLSNAAKGISRLVQLADDLDQISKLESGKIPLQPQSFLIQDLVKDIYEELLLKAQERNIETLFKKGTEAPLFVFADKEKIKQVLVNLIENAIKYGTIGGSVVTGFYEVDEGHIYIEVSDDGPGIAEQHLPRIFERFYRADKSRNRDIGGTGLGLAIVKHIVEAHGQQVTVRSKLGVGSSFGFTLARSRSFHN
jgi:two-component system phosphate regulon sensor histidine kinase PhoR